MKEFLDFKKMIAPAAIQILFWIFVIFFIILGLTMVFENIRFGIWDRDFQKGLVLLVIGPIATRLYCEFIIVIFSIKDILKEIKNLLQQRDQ
jgi:hypothetical protein